MSCNLSLSADDFSVIRMNENKYLRLNIADLNCIIMIYQDECPACVRVKPEFYKLCESLNREACSLATLNVSTNPDIMRKSHGTTTPIDRVPLIFFYKNGIPTKLYNGEVTEDNLFKFIKYAAEDTTDAKETSMLSNTGQYCNNDDCCYLTMDSAYK